MIPQEGDQGGADRWGNISTGPGRGLAAVAHLLHRVRRLLQKREGLALQLIQIIECREVRTGTWGDPNIWPPAPPPKDQGMP